MGQRLVITIENNKKNLAKAYYHWSGYTRSGLTTAHDAVAEFEKAKARAAENMSLQLIMNNTMSPETVEDKTALLTACYMLFATKAGLENNGDNSEADTFRSMFPNTNYNIGADRNDGLIAITSDEMENLQKWSEADVRINIDTKTVSVSGLFFSIDSDDEETGSEEVMNLDTDLDNISFDDLGEFAKTVITAINNRIYTFSNNGDTLGAIE